MSIKSPCLHCINRYIGCHSHCELYLKYKEENDKLKEKLHKHKEFEQMLYSFNSSHHQRLNRKR